MAIVYDRPTADDKITDLLWMVRVGPVCSPEVARANEGRSLADVVADNELLHVKLEGEPRAFLWANFMRQCGIQAEPNRGLSFDTAYSAVARTRRRCGSRCSSSRPRGSGRRGTIGRRGRMSRPTRKR